MKYQIWSEGYAATGEYSNAQYHGTSEGDTFKEAVDNLLKTWDQKEVGIYYNPDKLTYWGCRFFDNETDARKSFG